MAEVIHVPKSVLDSEKKSLNFLMDNYFTSHRSDDPEFRKGLKKKIKGWNKHIKDWKDLEDGVSIFAQRKSPVFDTIAGLQSFSYKDNVVSSSSYGPFFELMGTWYWKYRWPVFGLAKYQYFEHQGKGELGISYETAKMFTFELGLKRIPVTWPGLYQYASLEREELGILSGLNVDTTKTFIESDLLGIVKTAKLKILWVKLGLEYHFDFLGLPKEGVMQFLYGRAISGNVELDDGSSSASVAGNKYIFSFKQYFAGDFYLRTKFQYYLLTKGVAGNDSMISFSCGNTF
ncbi:MAG: hypothetical protein KAQ98_08180 [Bacteriovoracaceae bacterium]|nr:hypothetical protein [Bacteriovoracaceae bacterium]